jgi:hypothetical protein
VSLSIDSMLLVSLAHLGPGPLAYLLNDVSLVLKMLKPLELLFDRIIFLFGFNLVYESFLFLFFTSPQIVQLLLKSLFRSDLCQFSVVMVLLSKHLMVVVYSKRSFRAHKRRHWLIMLAASGPISKASRTLEQRAFED